jgi:PAS domain S-box-containing protein
MCPTFAAEELDAIYTNAPIGLALLDRDLRYLKVNHALAEMNGVPIEAHIGRRIHDVVPNVAPAVDGLFRSVFTTGKPVLNVEVIGETAGAPGVQRCWIENISPVLGSTHEVRAVLVTVTEITEQKATEERLRTLAAKEQHLMRELTHRISNGLGMVAALLDLQARSAAGPESRSAFQSASSRVRGLALIHRQLYELDEAGLVSDIRTYLSRLGHALAAALLRGASLRVDAEPGITLPPDRMVPLGIIVAELFTNACKHSGLAAPGISIVFRRQDGRGVLTVANEGQDLPAGFDPAASRGIGMTVVRSQIAQLYGELTAARGPSGGASFTVSFPLD